MIKYKDKRIRQIKQKKKNIKKIKINKKYMIKKIWINLMNIQII